MALANFSDLQSSVIGWLNKSNASAYIADWVALAEADFNSRIRIRQNTLTASLSLSQGASSVSLPTGFLEELELNYTDSNDALNLGAFDDVDRARNSQEPANRPWLYAITADSIVFNCNADATYPLLLRYWSRWQLQADTTNWLMTNFPNVYLFGTLVEAAIWDRNDSLLAMAQARKEEIIDKILKADSRTKGSVLRTDPALQARGVFNIQTGR